MTRLIFILLSAVLPYTGILHAQDVRVILRMDSSRIRIGEWIPARLSVAAPGDWRVVFPIRSASFTHVEIVASGQERAEQSGKSISIEKPYTLTSFDTGLVNVTATITYYKPGDTTAYSAVSGAVELAVASVPVDTLKSFRDIKDVLHVSLTIWDYLLYIGIIVAVAAGVFMGYRWYKRRPEPSVEPEPAPPTPADEVALEKLRALEQKRLWERGAHKDYQSELTEILREYVEHGFGVPALEQTTPEIIAGIAMLGFEPDLIMRTEKTLQTADMTKFAKYTPDPAEHRMALIICHDFVERTRRQLHRPPESTSQETAGSNV